MDSETKLVTANDFLFRMLGLPPSGVGGMRFGNAFGCDAVEGTDMLCGTAEVCSHCDLRNGIQAVLRGEVTLEDVELAHDFRQRGGSYAGYRLPPSRPASTDTNDVLAE